MARNYDQRFYELTILLLSLLSLCLAIRGLSFLSVPILLCFALTIPVSNQVNGSIVLDRIVRTRLCP